MSIEKFPRRTDEERELDTALALEQEERDRGEASLQEIAEFSGDLGTGVEALREVIALMMEDGGGSRFRLLQCIEAQLTRSWSGIERVCREAGAHTATGS